MSGNPALMGSALTEHALGHTLGGTGMSNPMKTFAGIETLLLKAPYANDTEFLIDVLDARAHASELSLRAAQSALLHQGARGYLMSSAVQRRGQRPGRKGSRSSVFRRCECRHGC